MIIDTYQLFLNGMRGADQKPGSASARIEGFAIGSLHCLATRSIQRIVEKSKTDENNAKIRV